MNFPAVKLSRDFAFFIEMMKKHKKELVAIVFLIGLSSGLTMLVPLWSKNLTSEILEDRAYGAVARYICLGAGLLISIQILRFLIGRFRFLLGNRVGAEIRHALFERTTRFSLLTLESFSGAELISRVSGDVAVFQEGFVSGVFILAPSLAAIIGLLAVMFWHSAALSLLVLVLLALIATIVNHFNRKIRLRAYDTQKHIALLNNRIEELHRGFREIKSFANEKSILERFEDQNRRTFQASMAQDFLRCLAPPLGTIIAVLGITSLLLISVYLVSRNQLESGDIAVFITCLFLIAGPMEQIASAFAAINRMYAAFDRFEEILRAPEEKTGGKGYCKKKIEQGGIRFEKVRFSYGDGFSLKDIDFEIERGETAAITGANGSGKSTLLNLVAGFFKPDEGTIFIDGLDIARWDLRSLRKQIAFVFQETLLFEGSLMENIAFADPAASEEKIIEAAKAANVHEFAEKLPNGYQHQVGRFGKNLSVGQRQRVSLARAFLADPAILILDEPTSALDSESDRLVNESLELLCKNRTTLIVTHKFSSIEIADKILILDNGKIVEKAYRESLEPDAKGLLREKLRLSSNFSDIEKDADGSFNHDDQRL